MTQTVAIPTRQRHRRVVLAPVIGLVVLAICGLVVVGVVAARIGVGAVFVGAICALLPVGPVVAAFLWVDRWEPEPPRLLQLAFLWGAGFAALSALLINSSAALAADDLLGRGTGDVLGAVAIAPFVEEAVKGLFLVGLLVFMRREIDGIVDGIVYAGLVAAGFAFTENILYMGRAFAEGVGTETGSVLTVLVLRGVFSPFAHPLFTSMTGIAVGLAAGSRRVGTRVLWVLGGYLCAVALHALWNGSATLGGSGTFITVYVAIMLPVFVATIVLIIWQRRREQRTVADQLPGFAAAGWIAQSEVELLASLAGRRGWRRAVRSRSGPAAARAVAEYQAAVTEMAFMRARIARGAVQQRAQQRNDEMLLLLKKARAKALGMPDALSAAWKQAPPPGWEPPTIMVAPGGRPAPAPTPPPWPAQGPGPGYGPRPGPPPPGYGARPGYGPPPGHGGPPPSHRP
ncbi:PrsW family intramembrane metalloprotease [Pseudonocardia benzenivorans]|uniref:PrsW family intramembrane metalloprotease n=1 Tax=Pseudonocardia benzenivorans TaxID=228005 RepID=A0ABW3VII6_9PSEU|nr:PrsW family intramembrane metalloprotease [Pseudonocardia dioxanivorans]